ncbi:hypothetical protein CHH28_13600 [Bacterioplanes sanyensis]|uniref:Peptidase M43 pregnancy-associated plasma-A domain-containing protein n=1 Tax=Bacterioplanes sanyensis TaxID=1249553 RepID=A0A222FN49_9GAMM|nr:M43 family zinc metalloprotease [Bacterioplanes sanyensis]ASP39643.1 hypothetical protein CHH28_13600 [Bacterioplanes sanyensis]
MTISEPKSAALKARALCCLVLTALTSALLFGCGGGGGSDDETSASLHLPLSAEQREAILTIPVVVHVIYRDAATNISEEKIRSQLAASNAHLRALNVDELSTVPAAYQPYIADARIQLQLAELDPDGNPTSGITRTASDHPVNGSCDYCTGTASQWDPKRYLNVWVGDNSNRHGDIASLGTSVGGPESNPDNWGLSIEYRAFGSLPPLSDEYSQGKTLTHELGHYLGLKGHIEEGDGHRLFSCDGLTQTSCSNAELSMSFMRTRQPDEQLKMFSVSQVDLMRITLLDGYLKGLARSETL